jgi:hypothetical protein
VWSDDAGLVATCAVALAAQSWVVIDVDFGHSDSALPALDLTAVAAKLPVLPQLFGVRRRLTAHTWSSEGLTLGQLATAAV